ncbi:anti-sigma-I factor RsgI2-like [Palaemon carinicauda]|uniref:anti-sigma-I factor RsgI2-like n=1 Tax=Palaemon carinicauda TaxID=392227 RepID=UPI0035B58216
MKGTSTPKTYTPALMSQPKDQRTPRQRRQRQPTTVPAPAIAKQRKSTIIPVPATKLQAVATPPAPATQLQAVSTPHPSTPTPQPTSLAQQIESLTLNDLIPIAIKTLARVLSLSSTPTVLQFLQPFLNPAPEQG